MTNRGRKTPKFCPQVVRVKEQTQGDSLFFFFFFSCLFPKRCFVEDSLCQMNGLREAYPVYHQRDPRLPGIPFCFSIVPEEICLLNIFEVSICLSTELCGLVEKSLSLEKSLAAQVPQFRVRLPLKAGSHCVHAHACSLPICSTHILQVNYYLRRVKFSDDKAGYLLEYLILMSVYFTL